MITAGVEAVVHLAIVSAADGHSGGRSGMKEQNVIGTMQLLAACQQAPDLRKIVVRSSTAAYGASFRDPAVFTESTEPREMPRGGFARDVLDIEGYVRGFRRRRPDVAATVLRFAPFIGEHAEHHADPLLRAADRADRARPRSAPAVRARRRRAGDPAPRGRPSSTRARSTSPAPARSRCPRRYAGPAGSRCRCSSRACRRWPGSRRASRPAASASTSSTCSCTAGWSTRPGWSTSSASSRARTAERVRRLPARPHHRRDAAARGHRGRGAHDPGTDPPGARRGVRRREAGTIR